MHQYSVLIVIIQLLLTGFSGILCHVKKTKTFVSFHNTSCFKMSSGYQKWMLENILRWLSGSNNIMYNYWTNMLKEACIAVQLGNPWLLLVNYVKCSHFVFLIWLEFSFITLQSWKTSLKIFQEIWKSSKEIFKFPLGSHDTHNS